MRKFLQGLISLTAIGATSFAILYWMVLPLMGAAQAPPDLSGLTGSAKRGAYVAAASGCLACHTDKKKGGKPFAGGHALKTPFGTFYAPNITSDRKFGIGDWSLRQFARALTAGISPKGEHYFPAFPYTSYSAMTGQDIVDLKAYMDTVTAVASAAPRHDLIWPASDRRFLGGWKWLYFKPAKRLQLAQAETGALARGAYLVNVLGHCGECHTQRGLLGGSSSIPLAGNTRGPEGGKVPAIAGMGRRAKGPWSKDDLITSLQMGMTPTGDFLGSSMAKVINHSTSKLTAQDLSAISDYLLSLR